MSRKRALIKKQQTSRETLLVRLEALDHRGADEDLLALAAKELPALATGELTERWAVVTEHVVRRTLARADFDRLSRLLLLGATNRRLPLVALAAAVVDLAAGRTEAARLKLEALAGGGLEAEGVGGDLLPALSALTAHVPVASEVEKFFLVLRKLEAAEGGPDARLRKTLHRAFESLRQATPADDAPAVRLLDSAGRCLGLLDELSTLATKLARLARKPRQTASQNVLTALHRSGSRLAAALAENTPLLAPLRHALRLRWRAVLEAVAAREGSDGLLALATTRPELVTPELDLPPGGLAGSAFQQARRVRALLAGEAFEQLAGLLRARAGSEKEPSDLAALWSLELWAMKRWEATDDDPFEEEPLDPILHQILERIETMAIEISRRFPAEQRPDVARGLREELFDVCEAIPFCEHTAGAASALLDHLEGDAGLLIAGVAGATVGDDKRCLRALETQLARRGKLRATERETWLRLMTQVAGAEPAGLARALEVLRPSFSDRDWEEVVERVARTMAPSFSAIYRQMATAAWLGPEERRAEHTFLRRDLERLRPALGTAPGFAAVELMFDCWEPDGPTPKQRVRTFLSNTVGYDAALIALDTLRHTLCPATPKGFVGALGDLAETTIDRLDDRWQRWLHAAPFLATGASRGATQRLEKRIRRLLEDRTLDGEARQQLEDALDKVDLIEGLKRETRRRKTPRTRPAKRRSRRGLQLELDLG